MSYDELYRSACRTANALSRAGVKAGDAVCIVCRNGIQYIEAMFAIAFVGAVPALINWRLAPVAVYDMLRQVDAKFAFISNTEAATAALLKERCGDELQMVLTAHEPSLPSSFASFSAGMPESFPIAEPAEEDAALIMFTSGTSGRAKGVELSNRALGSQIVRLSQSGLWHKEDVFLCLSPLCHAISLSVMALLYAGGELVLAPPEFIRDCDKVLAIVENDKVTSTALVPTVINRLVTYMEEHGIRNDTIQYIHYGASPMSWELLNRCGKVFSCRFNQGYGMTETYGTVVSLGPEDHLDPRHLSSVGRPAPGNELKIIDEAGNLLPAGEVGEVCVKTPAVMTRYIGMPERTAEVLRDGWYHTGDMGCLDEDGYLFLKDRKSDMIITGGENVYPQEVEQCIQGMSEDVLAVCVCGLPDPIWGEIIAAAVVQKAGSDLDEKQIIHYCGEHLGRYKRPKRLLFLDAIPTNDMGKVSRRKVKSLFTQQEKI